MTFTVESIGGQLKRIGYKDDTPGVMRQKHNGVAYGVDFVKQEIFKSVKGQRVYEDPDDELLNNTIAIVQTEDENKPLPDNNMVIDNSGSGESTPDATDQSSNQEEPSTTKDVVIPDKNIVSFTPGIKGMVPQLCECGKIKIGKKGDMVESKRGTKFRPPQKLDHFVVTTMQKTEDDDFEEDVEIMEKLGSNCTEIPVMLMYDNPDLNFRTSLAYYNSSKCECRGNGEVAIKVDGTQIKCDPDNCSFAKQKKCKPNGILSVVLTDATRVGGVWKFRTTGWNSIRNLMSSIRFIHGLAGGRLAGLPMMLTLQPKSTVIPGTNSKTTIYMVNLEFRGTMDELLSRASERLASPEQIAQIEKEATEMLALPESPEECKDVQEEFYPESFDRGEN